MNLPRHRRFLACALLLGGACSPALLSLATAADEKKEKPKTDIIGADKRRATVELAEKLTRPPEPAPLPTDLAQPFNPTGFDLTEQNERPVTTVANGVTGGTGDATAAARPAAPVGDRETLENLASRIVPTGTFIFGGQPLLIIGGNRLRVGSHFTVSANGQDYDLELTAVDRTNFTLRYHSEVVTRPIKSGK